MSEGALTVLKDRASAADLPAEERRRLVERLRREKRRRAARREPFPLSHQQRGLWFVHENDPAASAYHVALAARVHTPRLDEAALERALVALAERHEALRTRFSEVDGEPVQRFSREAVVPFDRRELTDSTDTGIELHLRAEYERPFDLEREPPIRVTLFHADGRAPVLFLVVHHIVFDFWSLQLLVEELGAIYTEEVGGPPARLPELPWTFREHVRGQRRVLASPRGEDLRRYWDEELGDFQGTLSLPYDLPPPDHAGSQGASCQLDLDPRLTRAVRRAARDEGTTLSTVLLTAYGVLLGHWTDDPEVLIGTMTSGRIHPETEGMVGCFPNPVGVRIDLKDDPRFVDLLARAEEKALLALEHQEYPYARLVEDRRRRGMTDEAPLLSTVFSLLRPHRLPELTVTADQATVLDLGELRLELLDTGWQQEGQFDLSLMMIEQSGELSALIKYDRNRFHDTTIRRMAGHYRTLLEAMVRDRRRRLSRMPMESPAECHQALIEWNDTASDLEGPEGAPAGGPIHRRVEERARVAPDSIAVVGDGEHLSYGTLARRAGRLARRVRARIEPDEAVVTATERSPHAVVSLLAVLEAGGVHVPVDPDDPPTRRDLVIRDSGARLVIANEGFQAPDGHRPLDVSGAEPGTGTGPEPGFEAPAYVIYTSGSTGRPKGVSVPHRALATHARGIALDWELSADDRVLQFASLAFDPALEQTLPTLAEGGTVILRDPGPWDAERFARMAAKERLTVANLPTAFWEQLAHRSAVVAALHRVESLRLLAVGGEAMGCEALMRWRGALPAAVNRDCWPSGETLANGPPDIRLLNVYGPTEAVITATAHEPAGVRPTLAGAVPIGRPLTGRRAYVLGRAGRPVPRGARGELWLGGPLATGYLERAALTADKFVPDPFSGTPGARLYRTGDRARQAPDGVLQFLGRIDRQIKLRGHRVEPGEVESALRRHAAVAEAVVGVPGADVSRRLVAWVAAEPDARADGRAIRSSLEGSLPSFLVPAAVLVLPGALPRTPAGKVDRRALPRIEDVDREGGIAPRGPIEAAIAEVWTEILGTPVTGVRESFFDLGGHSLLATRVIARVRSLFGVELALQGFWQEPTVAGLARRVGEALRGGDPAGQEPIPRVPREEDRRYPLSFAQERLWFLHRLDPDDPSYNIPAPWRMLGALDTAALARALAGLVARHEALRTRFAASSAGPFQRVDEPFRPALPVVDLRALPAGRRLREARRLVVEDGLRPFDLERGPLLRARLFRLDGQDHLLLLDLHHITADGWSLGVLMRDLRTIYRAAVDRRPPRLSPAPIQMVDFSAWQRHHADDAELAEDLAYWRRQLDGLPVLDLPTDRPGRDGESWRGAKRFFSLPGRLAGRLGRLGRDRGATLFMTLVAAFQVLLARHAGQDDVVVGTPAGNRERVELEGVVGFFVNALTLRTDLSGEPTFEELLDRVRRVSLEAFSHMALPFDRLSQELRGERGSRRQPIFRTLFALQNAPFDVAGRVGSGNPDGLTIRLEEIDPGTAKFDLTLSLEEVDGGIDGWLEYRTDLFDESTVRRLVRHFRTLLSGAAARPGRAISALPLLAPAERQQALVEWNDTAATLPREPTVVGLFEEWADRAPGAVAVDGGDTAVSYGELDRRANRLAHHLIDRGVTPGEPVGVCLPRGPQEIVGVVGVLKAGGTYVPLDADHPAERVAYMLADAGATLLVSCAELDPSLPAPGIAVSCVDRERGEIGARPDHRPEVPGAAERAAYVVYTSGSTGRPKGVVVSHRAVVRLVRETDYVALGPGSRVAQAANTSFDAATFEIWGPLLAGGCVLPLPTEIALSPDDLVCRLRERRVTDLFITTALFNQVADARPEGLSSLGHLLFGGEAVDPRRVDRVLQAGPPARLLHVYGPTESTTFATWHPVERVPDEATTVPIGQPIANTRAHVTDPRGRPVPRGAVGELVLGGLGLARGYLSRPGLTADAFVPDPFATEPGGRLYRTSDLVRRRNDGAVEFVGRRDHQVKIRGFRIEPGEIESALRLHPEVADAVVVVRGETSEDRRLDAYFAPAGAASRDGLRRHLRGSLPEFMVPASLTGLDELPLNPHGKVDRARLPDPTVVDAAEPGVDAGSGDPTREIVARLFEDILGRERVAADADFFDLGGHSLLATRLVARLRERFGRDVPLRWLFEDPTVGGLSGRLADAWRDDEPLPPLEPAPEDEAPEPSYGQRRLWVLDRLEPGSAFYNLPVAFRLWGRPDLGALHRSALRIVERHEPLRTGFEDEEGEPVLRVTGAGDLRTPVVDLRGLPAERAESEAARAGRALARWPFDLSSPPLLRWALARLGDDDHLLFVTMHHIVSDGWSLELFADELGELYRAEVEGGEADLPEIEVSYSDFARWQRRWLGEGRLERQLGHWRKRLEGAPPVLDLPTDRPRPSTQSYRGSLVGFPLAAGPGALDRLGRGLGVTRFMILLAAFQTLLFRFGGQSDVVVGSPVANRTAEPLERLIGFFVNTLVLRSDLGGRPTFRELLDRIHRVVLDAVSHQDLPFERLVAELDPERDPSHAPLFQVMLVLQEETSTALDLPELSMTLEEVGSGSTKFDLTLFATFDDDGGKGWIEYSTDLFDATTVRRFGRSFATLLAAAADRPERTITELPVLATSERHQVIREWGTGDGPRARPRTVDALFREWVERRPDARAVVAPGADGGVTYRELDERATRIARRLRASGAVTGRPVGICARPSVDLVAAILGVLKAGGAYLPLDPAYPGKRLAHMLEDSGARTVLVEESLEERLPAGGRTHLRLGDDADRAPALDATDRAELAFSPASPGHPAYLIYTSGSTGLPKGVLVSHANLAASTRARFDFYRRPVEAFLLLSSFAFDSSVAGIFWTLCGGGTLVLPDREAARDVDRIAGLIDRHAISHLLAIPSLYEMLLTETGPAVRLESLRTAIVAGEVCPAELVDLHHRRLPEASLVNEYGPTEGTVWATGAHLHPGEVPVPIGRPPAHARVHVLDPRGRAVSAGAPGELVIGGRGVTLGYMGRPAKTAERFVPDPFGPTGRRLYRTGDLVRHRADGALEFLGRLDHQVKIRGFRIEPREVEEVLTRHPEVTEAAVVVRGDDSGGPRLVGYVAGAPGEGPSAESVRELAGEHLPRYAVPADLVVLDAMPRNAHGKLDRDALPAPERSACAGPDHEAPRDEIEATLARVWAEVLRVDQVGVHDNFFRLGGDSILSIRLCSRAGRRGLAVTPKQLFHHQTVASLARVAERIEAVTAEQEPVTGTVPLSAIQRWFLEREPPVPEHYDQSLLLATRRFLRGDHLEAALAALLRHHDALRLRFERTADGWRQTAATPGGYTPFLVVDHTALPAAHRDRALDALATGLHQSLDLADGPLLRSALVRGGAGEGPEPVDDRVLTVAQHLVVDGVSWGILREDLEIAYGHIDAGEPVRLPDKSTSYRAWSRHQRDEALRAQQEGEPQWWLDRPWKGVDPLPGDHRAAADTEGLVKDLGRSLGADTSRVLLHELPGTLERVDTVLLAALAEAFHGWTGQRRLAVELEGHGREVPTDGDARLDLARTVGWITSLYPVLLDRPEGGDTTLLRSVKERLAAVPAGGRRFAPLTFFAPDPEVRAALLAIPRPEVSFNYLGRMDRADHGAGLTALDPRVPGRERSPRNPRPYPLELVVYAHDGGLHCHWRYAGERFDEATMAALADRFVRAAERLARVVRERPRRLLTPSDFPLAGLSDGELRAVLDGGGPPGAEPEDLYPLTPVQEGMLFHTLSSELDGVYVEQVGLSLRGRLDPAALRRAWRRLAERHPVLRSACRWEDVRTPLQVVYRDLAPPVAVADWSGLPDEARERARAALWRDDRRRGFALDREVASRTVVARLAGDHHELLWSHHHLLLDGWCLTLLFDELFHFYGLSADDRPAGDPQELPETRPYRDFVAWLAERDPAAAEPFWRRLLAGFDAPTPLPPAAESDRPGNAVRTLRLSEERTEALRAFGRRHGVTSATLVQGAWALVLGHLTDRRDVVFGATVAGRPADLHGVESMLGMFINTLPVRALLSTDSPLGEWLAALQEQGAEARRHEHTPLARIRAWSDLPADEDLFETIVVVGGRRSGGPLGDGFPVEELRLESVRGEERTHYPLTLATFEDRTLVLELNYSLSRFDEPTIERLLTALDTVLARFTAEPEASVGAVLEHLARALRAHRIEHHRDRRRGHRRRLRSLRRRSIETDTHLTSEPMG